MGTTEKPRSIKQTDNTQSIIKMLLERYGSHGSICIYEIISYSFWTSVSAVLCTVCTVAIGILFTTIGWAMVPGLLIIILTIILNNPLAKSLQKCQAEVMAAQGERLRVTSEILNSMKIIRLQAWEEKFKELMENLRAVEFKWLSSAQFNRTYGAILFWMSPIIVESIVFAACAVIGDPPLTATTIFTVLATFQVMQEPVRMLPDVLAILIQFKVSLDRLDKFLQDDELRADAVVRKSLGASHYTIKIHQGIFSWDTESSLPTLKGVNLQIKKGEKVAICGSVGCGKSALLYTILGEIPKIAGDVQVYGSIAYVAQTVGQLPGFGVGATVMLNILMAGSNSGGAMNPVRTLGPAVAAGNYKAIWVYIVAPITGALLGAAAYTVVRLKGDPDDN